MGLTHSQRSELEVDAAVLNMFMRVQFNDDTFRKNAEILIRGVGLTSGRPENKVRPLYKVLPPVTTEDGDTEYHALIGTGYKAGITTRIFGSKEEWQLALEGYKTNGPGVLIDNIYIPVEFDHASMQSTYDTVTARNTMLGGLTKAFKGIGYTNAGVTLGTKPFAEAMKSHADVVGIIPFSDRTLMKSNSRYVREQMVNTSSSAYRPQDEMIRKVWEVDKTYRFAEVYDGNNELSFYLISSKHAGLYNAIDLNQPLYSFSSHPTEGETIITLIVGGMQGDQELDANLDYESEDARKLARTLVLNSANIKYHQDHVLSGTLFRYPTKSHTIVRTYVLSRRGAKRLYRLAAGKNVAVQSNSFKDQYAKMQTSKRLVYNDILYGPSDIQYQGQQVKVSTQNSVVVTIPEFLNSTRTNGLQFTEVTFDNIMDSAAEAGEDLTMQCGPTGRDWEPDITLTPHKIDVGMSLRLTMGEVFAEITNDKKIRVNGIRINKADLRPSLKKAFMFRKQDVYNNFLRQASRMSLPMRNMVTRGVVVTAKRDMDYGVADDVDFNLAAHKPLLFNFTEVKKRPMLQSKHGVFQLKNALYLYSRDQTDLIGKEELYAFMKRLIRTEDIELYTKLIAEASDNYQSMKLALGGSVERTLKVTKAVSTTLVIGSEQEIPGYEVKGTLDTYFLSTEENTFANVYRAQTGDYICMVDKAEYIYPEQRLVARLLILANDAKLAAAINTL